MMRKVKMGLFFLMFIGIAILFLHASSHEAKATYIVTDIDVTIKDTVVNSTASAEAHLTYYRIGSPSFDGEIVFNWYNESGALVHTETTVPDGSGYAYSSYVPTTVGVWYINASYTGTTPTYDNKSFSVFPTGSDIIDNITWSTAVRIDITFYQNYTFIGQKQNIKIQLTNTINNTPIIGVPLMVAVETSDGIPVLDTMLTPTTCANGTAFQSFTIPLDTTLEDRYMQVMVSVASIDYTGTHGWLGTARHIFYCGYYLRWENEVDGFPVQKKNITIVETVPVWVNYTINYSKDFFVANFVYQAVNLDTGYVTQWWSFPVLFEYGSHNCTYQIPLPEDIMVGDNFLRGYAEIEIPTRETDTIRIYGHTQNFTVMNNTILEISNPIYIVSPENPEPDDTIFVYVNVTVKHNIDGVLHVTLLNNEDNNLTYFRMEDWHNLMVGTYPIIEQLKIPHNTPTGWYRVTTDFIYSRGLYTFHVTSSSNEFYINGLNARASSDIDVFANYTIIQCNGSNSTGYNDTYWGFTWTSTHDPTRVWHGMKPKIIIDKVGTFKITLNVTDGNGNYSEDFFYVTTFPPPTPEVTLTTLPGFGNTYRLTIVLEDIETGKRVNNANIIIDGSSYGTANGIVEVTLSYGGHWVEVWADGYSPARVYVNLVDDTTFKVFLYPEQEPTTVVQQPATAILTETWFWLPIFGLVLLAGLFWGRPTEVKKE